MDSNSLYDELKDLDSRLSSTAEQFTNLHETIIKLMEENAELKIENQNLRDKLKDDRAQENPENENQLSKSRLNLEKLYHEGFHVCSDYYGKRREDGEECIFCTEIIYGRR
ncbi:DNA replication initiation control protein YabA [Lentilactobacillus sp. Marseille-Q4993]|uniref:DNA replication initiation control protein YabA n=1 Tax=Lentilactobacillus sp. Marseille-Q4993 TaxID=3039492 RepID=UPI0024BC66F6|nr:DNA replication initiation control protein YabA [Lentilactobacillus sp. Marseille-Q4993]